MSAPPSPVTDSSITPPLSPPPSSLWNFRTVQAALGIGALGVALFIIKQLVESTSSPSTTPPDPPPDPPHLKFLSEQHRSGLRWGSRLCVNEAKALNFDKYAEAIIHIEPFDLDLVDPDDFFITCSPAREYPKPERYFEQRANPAEGLTFFVPNLPFNTTITVTFGIPQWQMSIQVHINQPRGLYTIFRENQLFQLRSQPLPTPVIFSPVSLTPISLQSPLVFILSQDGKATTATPQKAENGQLIIKNLFKKSVIYLQLESKRRVINADQRDLVLPFVIGEEKQKALSQNLLNILWKNAYRGATSKQAPDDDLDLHLSGYQQIIYTDLASFTPEKPA